MRVRSKACTSLVVAVALLSTACAPDDNPGERREALRDVISSLELEPRSDESEIEVSETQSKNDFPYYVATGVLPGERPEAVDDIERVLAASSWELLESRSVDNFLGWRIRGLRENDEMVVSISVGPRGLGNADTYPELDGRVYVQASVGRLGSNQAWTQVTPAPTG